MKTVKIRGLLPRNSGETIRNAGFAGIIAAKDIALRTSERDVPSIAIYQGLLTRKGRKCV